MSFGHIQHLTVSDHRARQARAWQDLNQIPGVIVDVFDAVNGRSNIYEEPARQRRIMAMECKATVGGEYGLNLIKAALRRGSLTILSIENIEGEPWTRP